MSSQEPAGISAQLLAPQDLAVECLLPLFVSFLAIWLLRVSRWLCTDTLTD